MYSKIFLIKMPSFKFSKIEIEFKNFRKQKRVTDVFKSMLTEVVSNTVACNNGKNWRYIVGYQVEEKSIIPLFINAPKNIFWRISI